jgi:uncharacterized protein YaiL (DUF2058 family)
MGLENTVEKLDKYYKRLKKGKAQKIKPSHVSKVISKLETKENLLLSDLAEAGKEAKKQRLDKKLAMVRAQLDRARWLLSEIAGS